MHETDCKMLDIDSDTNFIHLLLQEGIMKSVLMDWFYGNSGRQWSIKMWCTRLTIIFSSINQYFLYIVFTSTLLCNFKQRSLLIILCGMLEEQNNLSNDSFLMKYHHDITLYREKSNNMPKCTNFYSTKQYIVYLLFVISKKKKK